MMHSKKVGHAFGINSSNGLLFCFKCSDYIGDNELIMASMLNKYWDDVSIKTMVPSEERRDGLNGLLNLGSTCFMSSILQILIRNPYFFNFSTHQSHTKNCAVQDPKCCVSCALEKMVSEFYGSPPYSNSEIETQSAYSGFIGLLVCSWKTNENLAGYSQQDAHEFWQFLLNQIHYDFQACKGQHANDSDSDENCTCIAHTTFQGSLESSIVCPECQNNSKSTIDPFMDLSLDIKNKSNLRNCLDSFHKKERLHDFNYHCQRCNTSQDAIKRLSIYKLPPVLVFQLKRFEHLLNGTSSKMNDFIEYPPYLNMRDYCDSGDTDVDVPDLIYELIGVVAHKGTVNEGHYVATTKVAGRQWFKFNDSMVSSVTPEESLKEQAYLLFYSILQVN